MSTTISEIEVADDVLKEAMRRSGMKEPKAAVIEALREYVRPRSQQELIQFLGTSDSFFTPEQLEKQREIDSCSSLIQVLGSTHFDERATQPFASESKNY